MIIALLLAAAPVADRGRCRARLRRRRPADRPMDRVPQICRPRRGHVHAPGGVGARISSRAARTRPSRSTGGRAQSFVSCDGRTAVNTGPCGHAPTASRSAISPPSGSATRASWRWVYDGGATDRQGNCRRKPAKAARSSRASCRTKAPGAPVIAPLPLTDRAGAQDARGQRPRRIAPTRPWAGTGRSTRTAAAISASILWNGRALCRGR